MQYETVAANMDNFLATAKRKTLIEYIRGQQSRLRTYAEKCNDIEGFYINTDWADGQIINATFENRVFEAGMMASDDLGTESRISFIRAAQAHSSEEEPSLIRAMKAEHRNSQ